MIPHVRSCVMKLALGRASWHCKLSSSVGILVQFEGGCILILASP